jgi:hypothetical protein
MRVVLHGQFKIHELAGEFTRFIENMEANGVEEVDTVNLYFTPSAMGRTMRFYNASGDEIDILRFNHPAPRSFVPVSEGVTLESKHPSNPKDASRHRRMLRGEVPASHTLDEPAGGG